MSQENVELTLRIVEAWNRRNVEAGVALWDPDGVWYAVLEGITEGGRTYRGHAGMRQYFEDLAEFSEESHVEYSEVHDLGDEVLCLGRIWIRFASGVDLDQEVAVLHTWRNRKCVEARGWLSHAEALEAAGLSEYAMSQENVETVRRAIEAWNRRDLDGFLKEAHPDLEWHPVLAAGVEGSGGVYRGHDGAQQFWTEFRAMFDEFRFEIQDARAVGTSVLILAQIYGRAHSGVPVDTPWGAVVEMRDGLCVRTEEFLDHESALEAAGLSE